MIDTSRKIHKLFFQMLFLTNDISFTLVGLRSSSSLHFDDDDTITRNRASYNDY